MNFLWKVWRWFHKRKRESQSQSHGKLCETNSLTLLNPEVRDEPRIRTKTLSHAQYLTHKKNLMRKSRPMIKPIFRTRYFSDPPNFRALWSSGLTCSQILLATLSRTHCFPNDQYSSSWWTSIPQPPFLASLILPPLKIQITSVSVSIILSPHTRKSWMYVSHDTTTSIPLGS